MNDSTKRILGILLIVLAVPSLILSVVGLFGVWAMRQPVIDYTTTTLDAVSQSITTTEQALKVAADGLSSVTVNIDNLEKTTRGIAGTLNTSRPALTTAAATLSNDVPRTVREVRTTIASAQTSARLVDDFLTNLANIPFLNLDYRPQVPINVGLARVGTSLDPLPNTLQDLGGNLGVMAKSLDDVSKNVTALADSIGEINKTVTGAQTIVRDYQGQMQGYQATLASLKGAISSLMTVFALAATFILFWLAVVQVAALLQGVAWARTAARRQTAVAPRKVEAA